MKSYITIFSFYGLLAPSTVTPTPTSTTVTPSPTPTPNGFNNIGISDDSNTATANYDSYNNSYSTQALRAAGDNAFDPTRTVTFT